MPQEPEVVRATDRVGTQPTRSWVQAYMAFLRDTKQGKALKMAPLALAGIVPVTILDDLLLPGIGLLDNIPTSVLIIVVVVMTINKVRQYR